MGMSQVRPTFLHVNVKVTLFIVPRRKSKGTIKMNLSVGPYTQI